MITSIKSYSTVAHDRVDTQEISELEVLEINVGKIESRFIQYTYTYSTAH